MKTAIAVVLVIVTIPAITLAQGKEKFATYNYYKNRAYVAQHNNQVDSAIFYFKKASGAGTGTRFFNDIGNLLMKRGAYREAVTYFEKDIADGDLLDNPTQYL